MKLPGTRHLQRLLLESLGWVLVVAGLAMLVLPGPGFLTVFAGVALLSRQYEWARKALEPVRLRALRGAAESVETWPRIMLSCLAAAVIAGFGVLWIVQPEAPGWWPIGHHWWLFGGRLAGVTLLVSAAAAYALIVYSFRRFYGRPDARQELERQIVAADVAEEEEAKKSIPD